MIRHPNLAFLFLLFLGCTSCGLFNSTHPWSYIHPPKLKSKISIPDGGVWCASLESAKFMATTGWFAPDCTNNPIANTRAEVVEILPFLINGVSMLVVRATDANLTYWIPLPDHNWS